MAGVCRRRATTGRRRGRPRAEPTRADQTRAEPSRPEPSRPRPAPDVGAADTGVAEIGTAETGAADTGARPCNDSAAAASTARSTEVGTLTPPVTEITRM